MAIWNVDRRSYIQSVGALGSIGFIGTTAAQEVEPVPAEEAGVLKTVKKLFQQNKIEQAERLLDEHGVRYTSNGRDVTHDSARNESDFSAEGHYSESASEIYMSLVETNADDEWLATGYMTLADRVMSVRGAAAIPDACGIVYDNSEWTSVDPSEDNAILSCNSYAKGDCNISMAEYDPNNGLAVEVDLPYSMSWDTQVNVQTTLTRVNTGNDDIPVKFEYKHIWTLLNQPWNMSVSVGYGGLDISLSFEASVLWDDHLTAAPGEAVGPE